MALADEHLGIEELAAVTANRLCAVQARLADTDAQMREEHLAEEVERALMQVRADEQDEFLALLASRFPSWDSDLQGSAGGERTQSSADKKELSDPAFLAKRLVEVCKDLPEAKREAVKNALGRGGLLGGGTSDWPAEDLAKLRQAVFGGEAVSIEASRALQLLRMLISFATHVDKLAWKTIEEISERNVARTAQPIGKVAARFLSKHEQVPSGVIEQDLEKLRRLAAAFVVSSAKAGPIAYQKVGKLRPSAIEDFIRGSLIKGKGAACWEKYCELASSTLDQAQFELDVQREIARHIEVTVGGRS